MAAQARARRGLVALPRWLLAPSRYQRHWVRYAAAAAAAAAGVRFLYRRAPARMQQQAVGVGKFVYRVALLSRHMGGGRALMARMELWLSPTSCAAAAAECLLV